MLSLIALLLAIFCEGNKLFNLSFYKLIGVIKEPYDCDTVPYDFFSFFSAYAKLCEKQNKLSTEILLEHEVRISYFQYFPLTCTFHLLQVMVGNRLQTKCLLGKKVVYLNFFIKGT